MKNYKFTLSPNQETNLKNVVLQNGSPLIKETKKTIFADNKTFANVLFEGLLFAFGSCVFLTITAGLLIAFINLLNY